MGMSRLIEYILSIREPGITGRPLCHHGGVQFVVDPTPPLWENTFELTPTGYYALLVFSFEWGPSMIPDTFRKRITWLGLDISDVIVSSLYIRRANDLFSIITESAPFVIYTRNLTNLNQYLEIGYQYLRISTEEHLKTIYKELDALKVSSIVPYLPPLEVLTGKIG